MKKLTLEIDQTITARLERLVSETAAGSIVEVIRRALAVYDYLQAELAMAGEVIVRRADGTEIGVEVR